VTAELELQIAVLQDQLARSRQQRPATPAPTRPDLLDGQVVAETKNYLLRYEPQFTAPINRGEHRGHLALRADTPYIVRDRQRSAHWPLGRPVANCATEATARWWLQRLS